MELGSQIANPLEVFEVPETDYNANPNCDSNMGAGPSTPQNKQRRPKDATNLSLDLLSTLPDEVLTQIVTRLENKADLCALASVAKRWQSVIEGCEDHWRMLFQQAYCLGLPASPAQHRAAELARSWKRLFQSRFLAQAEAAPWDKPSPFETKAAIEQMYFINSSYPQPTSSEDTIDSLIEITSTASTEDNSSPTLPSTPPKQHQPQQQQQEQPPREDTCIIFLVDGSGSVTEEDFNCMKSFMITAGEQIDATQKPHQRVYLGIVQFSNEVKVEMPPWRVHNKYYKDVNEEKVKAVVDCPFSLAVGGMVRINGGTNIAAAIQKAGQLFKTLTTDMTNGNGKSSMPDSSPLLNCRKVIALLTDGRIDSFQSQEAKEITARLVDEQGNVELHAFGVGRGVDRLEMLRIVGGACAAGEDAANRYLPLMVLDDAPW